MALDRLSAVSLATGSVKPTFSHIKKLQLLELATRESTTNVPVRRADASRTKIYHTCADSKAGAAFGAIEKLYKQS